MSSVRRHLILLGGIAALLLLPGCGRKDAGPRPVRVALLEELHTVALKNCDLKRFGSAYDGGYLMCANLIKGVESAYSYGIADEDNWGCQMSKEFGVPTHEYDCFTPFRPTCAGGKLVYHDECVGDKAETRSGKPFDSLGNQIKKNGDAEKHVIVKMDVEGAEWDTFLATPESVFDRIDSLVMEFHGVGEPKYAEVMKKLKKQFFLVSVHFNNYSCHKSYEPLPARAFQALLVNKRIGVLDPNGRGHVPGAPPDAPDGPQGPDCQPATWN